MPYPPLPKNKQYEAWFPEIEVRSVPDPKQVTSVEESPLSMHGSNGDRSETLSQPKKLDFGVLRVWIEGGGRKSLTAIEEVRRRLEEWKPDVMVLASTHWMPREGFFIDDGAMHKDGCDASYKGVEPQLFGFPGDSELAALAAHLGKEAGLPVRRLHRVAQEHAVWVPSHLLCGERIPVVPCSIWWHGPREAHRRLGEVFAEAVRRLGRKAFFVASGGLGTRPAHIARV